MIDISIIRSGGNYTNLCVEGHAFFADSGKDIVCAAVSVLVINTINSIERYSSCDISITSDESKGYIDCTISDADHESNLLMQSMILGLNEISKTYSDRYVHINIKEV